jgi:ATP-binding cassette subfamily B protein
MLRSFPFFPQHDAMDCGPACLRMVAKYYGLDTDLQTLRSWSSYTRDGVSLLGIARSAERLGYRRSVLKLISKNLS